MNQIVGDIDSFVWGHVTLCLLVGTGIYLTAYLNFRTWRNLPYAMKSVFFVVQHIIYVVNIIKMWCQLNCFFLTVHAALPFQISIYV